MELSLLPIESDIYILMETPNAEVKDAKELRDRVRTFSEDLMFAYNLSPSFNWSVYDDDYI